MSEQRRSFAELNRRADQLPAEVDSSGVGVRDHIAVCAENWVEWLESLIAAFELRSPVVNITDAALQGAAEGGR